MVTMPHVYERGRWEITPWPLILFMPCYRRSVRMPDGSFVWEYSI